jgi:hypothetical protein
LRSYLFPLFIFGGREGEKGGREGGRGEKKWETGKITNN